MTPRRRSEVTLLRRGGALILLVLGLTAPAAHGSATIELQRRADGLIHDGYDRPDEALAALARLEHPGDGAVQRRTLTLARGLIAARAGRTGAAETAARALREMAVPVDGLADADAALVLAALHEQRGDAAAAAEHALSASIGYQSLCGRAVEPRDDCDHRNGWRALQLLAASAASEGNLVAARQAMQRAEELAQRAGDVERQAWSLGHQAVYNAADATLAQSQLAQARRLAGAQASPELRARLLMCEALVLRDSAHRESARRLFDAALPLVREARSLRLEAVLWANLSDHEVRSGRHRDALAAAQRALPIARRYDDLRTERVLLHNATLARLGLGQLAEAKRDMARLWTLWSSGGGAGEQATALREFGRALAGAGDVRGALEFYHRERKLAADIMAANRDSALRDLRSRYDREAQQRNIELLERDNAIKGAQLANRDLWQRIWTLVAVTLGLATVMVLLLVRRVRETNRQLAQSHAWLRVQSERDALTGLANRRHFQDVMRARGGDESFEGALMLVDIDHFKQVNDSQGHAAGDQVLVEVAKRLNEAVRAGDLVVRWGGEEFLVFAPGVSGAALDQLAARVLHGIGDTPVALGDGALAVTASVGYAGFPLPPHGVKPRWEQAVNLADMALYTAKNQGRHRAVGIVALQAPAIEGLQAAEADFERACQDGRVELQVTRGRPN